MMPDQFREMRKSDNKDMGRLPVSSRRATCAHAIEESGEFQRRLTFGPHQALTDHRQHQCRCREGEVNHT